MHYRPSTCINFVSVKGVLVDLHNFFFNLLVSLEKFVNRNAKHVHFLMLKSCCQGRSGSLGKIMHLIKPFCHYVSGWSNIFSICLVSMIQLMKWIVKCLSRSFWILFTAFGGYGLYLFQSFWYLSPLPSQTWWISV